MGEGQITFLSFAGGGCCNSDNGEHTVCEIMRWRVRKRRGENGGNRPIVCKDFVKRIYEKLWKLGGRGGGLGRGRNA